MNYYNPGKDLVQHIPTGGTWYIHQVVLFYID